MRLSKGQGYYILCEEGYFNPAVDFIQFAKYRRYNSKPMAYLLETLAIDDIYPIDLDATFMINGKDLALIFRWHMSLLLHGVDNTSSTNYEDQKIQKAKDTM